MIKTHPKSTIVQFHHGSQFARTLIGATVVSCDKIVLQIEQVRNEDYDYLAEIVDKKDYNTESVVKSVDNQHVAESK